MSAIIPDVFCQVTLIVNADSGRKLMGKHVRACGQPAVSPYGLCRQHQADRERLSTPGPCNCWHAVIGHGPHFAGCASGKGGPS